MSYHIFQLLISTVWLFMLLVAVKDCLKSNNENKPRWIAVIVLLPFVGPLCYFGLARGRFVSEL